MSSFRVVRSLIAGLAVLALAPASALAQVDVAVTGGLDVTNQYNFRGIRQNTAEVKIWP